MRAVGIVLLGCGLVGCDGRSVIEVTVDSTGRLASIESLRVVVMNGGQTAKPVIFAAPDGPIDIPPAQAFELGFAPERRGALTVTIEAISHGMVVASASGTGAIEPGHFTKMTVVLPGLVAGDMSVDAQAPADTSPLVDGTMPDGASPPDLAAPDFGAPDMSASDLAMPDLAMPDLAMPDLLKLSDLIPLPTCHDKIQNGNETDIDCGGSDCPPCDQGQGCIIATDCKDALYCPNKKCLPRLALGVKCGGMNPDECLKGNYCVDSVCCGAMKCDGCKQCNLSGKEGQCVNAPVNTNPHGTCTLDVAHCQQATCNGSGNCAALDGTMCGSNVCDSNMGMTTVPVCKSGMCILMTTKCAPYVCNVNKDACLSQCVTDAECNAASYCAKPACVPRLFGAPITIGAGALPVAIAAADFNNDLTLDLAVVDAANLNAIIAFGDGTGNFKKPVKIPLAGPPRGIVADDFNGDQNIDVAITRGAGTDIFLGDGHGKFTLKQTAAVAGSHLIFVGEFDNDGVDDILVAQQNGVGMSVMAGLGDGTFANPMATAASGYASRGVAVADLDGDGLLDAAVTSQDKFGSKYFLSLMYGDAKGRLNLYGSIIMLAEAGALAAADLDGDKKIDLIMAGSSHISVLMNTGNFTFAPPITYPSAGNGLAVVVADCNHDGYPDIAVTNDSDNVVTVLLGDKNGNFSARHDYPVGMNPITLIAADFNGDGKPDLATANSGSNDVSVLLNVGP